MNKIRNSNKNIRLMQILIAVVLSVFMVHSANAAMKLDNIIYDPAIISSGDTVDIIVQFHYEQTDNTDTKINNPEYVFSVTLDNDDTLTRNYVIIQDAEGDKINGVYRNSYYNTRYRIKVKDNAPSGDYEFKLAGQWIKNGEGQGSTEYMKFTMPVKKEGISLSISNVVSEPIRVRSGDKNVLLTTEIFNSGEKSAKNVNIKLVYPEGITSSYTNNNQITVGVIETMQTKAVQFYVDTDKLLKEGVYDIKYFLEYQDMEGNSYTTEDSFPFVVKKKPHIVVVESSGEAVTGSKAKITAILRNDGEETADAVDIRIVKQSSQPFEMDVRSDYLGMIRPGESATAVFTIDVLRDAEIKVHNLNVMIRAKGDAEEGDDNIYTFSDSVKLSVTGIKNNPYPIYAALFLVISAIIAITTYNLRKKR